MVFAECQMVRLEKAVAEDAVAADMIGCVQVGDTWGCHDVCDRGHTTMTSGAEAILSCQSTTILQSDVPWQGVHLSKQWILVICSQQLHGAGSSQCGTATEFFSGTSFWLHMHQEQGALLLHQHAMILATKSFWADSKMCVQKE
jgi:hypothetical protein